MRVRGEVEVVRVAGDLGAEVEREAGLEMVDLGNISAVATIPSGTTRFRRGPQSGFDCRSETRRLRVASRAPYCMKTSVT